jgi:hypothetical protein
MMYCIHLATDYHSLSEPRRNEAAESVCSK